MQMEGIFEKNELTSQEVSMSTEMHSYHSALAVLSIWTHLWNSGVVTISTL